MDALPIVDPHQHFWNLETGHCPHWLVVEPSHPFRYGSREKLRRSYMPADYRCDAARHNVVKTVHVEVEWNSADPLAETRWLSSLRDREGLPTAAVGQAWFERADIAEVLAGHALYNFMRGVRQKPVAADNPGDCTPGAPGSMGHESFRRGYALLARHGFSYDLQTPWWHLPEAADLARSFPGTTLILNHTGLPAGRDPAALAAWRRALEGLARQPNACLKLSGIGSHDQSWNYASNERVVLDAISIFGVHRCMFASNFPVDGICASFDTIYSGFKRMVAAFPLAEQRALLHDNAVRIYRL